MPAKPKLTIAAIGDSITAGFHIASDLNMFLRMWVKKKNSWFSEIVRQIREKIPVVSYNFSSAGSKLSDKTFPGPLDKLFRIKNMGAQVDEVLQLDSFPDMVLIWMGHNDLNWLAKKEKDITKIGQQFGLDFQKQLERLCVQATQQNNKTAIIVLGFINIRTLFYLRDVVAAIKKQNSKLFPYFEKGYKMFPSMRPEYKEQTIKLADMMNTELANSVAFCQNNYQNDRFCILYSDDLSKLSTNSPSHVTAIDGWHPSIEGQKQLAKTIWPVIEKELEKLLN